MAETYLEARHIRKETGIQATYLYYLSARGFIKTRPYGIAGRNRLYCLEDVKKYQSRPTLDQLVRQWLTRRYPHGVPAIVPAAVVYDCIEELYVSESTFRHAVWQLRKEQAQCQNS